MKKQRNNGKIIFAGLVILFIGTMYLFLQSIELFYTDTNLLSTDIPGSKTSRNELLFDVRTYLYILFGLTGGIGLLLGKKWGWVLGIPYLILYIILASWGILRLADMGMMNEGGYLMIVAWFILLIAFVFLLTPSTFQTLKLRPSAFIPASIVMLFLFWLYFYVQLK